MVRRGHFVLLTGMLIAPAFGQTAGMLSFQGLIKDGDGNPITSPVDLEFRVYDTETDGAVVAGPFGPTAVTPNVGVVSTKFGPVDPSVFNGARRWLEVSVDGDPLSRFEMVTAPATAEQLNVPETGTPAVHVDSAGNVGIGTTSPGGKLHISGGVQSVNMILEADTDDARETDQPSLTMTQDGGATTAHIGFFDGNDTFSIRASDRFDLHIRDGRILLMIPSTDVNFPDSPSIVAGHHTNTTIGESLSGSVIAGGGAPGAPNRVLESFATISGGRGNTASGERCTIAGGLNNSASLTNSVVSGGLNNTASEDNSTVGGGSTNMASGRHSTVSGGLRNHAEGQSSNIPGGRDNIASGDWSTVPGGRENVAGADFSFAAGNLAMALHQGAFVWSDSSVLGCESERDDQFRVCAEGGARFDDGAEWVDIRDDGTNLISTSSGAALTLAGAWANASDRDLKENITPIDALALLSRLDDLPISSWNYKCEDASVLHVGPMAQDFYSAFGLGQSDKSITTIDSDGVALAAIQGLFRLLQDKEARLDAQNERITAHDQENESRNHQIADLTSRLIRLEAMLAKLQGTSAAAAR